MADEKRSEFDIGALSNISGVNTSTIRTWENRYRVLAPSKTETGRRLYDQDDVDRLVPIKQLQERGHKISRLGGLPTQELLALFQTTPALQRAAKKNDLFEGLVSAIDADDIEKFRRWLAFSVAELTPKAAVEELFQPILRLIGDRWHAGQTDVAQEHMLSEVIRTQLLSSIAALKATEDGPLIAFATLSGDAHEFGAMMACYLASGMRFRTAYFGANVPPEDLAAAAKRMDADLIVLSSIFASNANLAHIEKLSSLLKGSIPIWLGCSSQRVSSPSNLPKSVEIVPDFRIFDARLSALEKTLGKSRD